jgi:hypothetical protein
VSHYRDLNECNWVAVVFVVVVALALLTYILVMNFLANMKVRTLRPPKSTLANSLLGGTGSAMDP